MFNKNNIKENYDRNFEEFLSSDFSKASINNFIDTDIANKKNKVKNFWNDDDDSTSSMQIGTGKSFLKRAPIISGVNTDNNNENNSKIMHENDVESDTHHSDLRLNINHSSDKSQLSNLNEDDELNKHGLYAHPMTFEGITDTMIDRSYSPSMDAGPKSRQKNAQSATIDTIKSNLSTMPVDKSGENFQKSLDKTEKEHLLSKVSLLDSYDVHKHGTHESGPNDSLKPEGAGDSYYKNSINPASGDSYNYTQGITNITDTVIGDTTAADLAAIHKHYDKYINKESSELSPGSNLPISETIKEILDHSTLRYDDVSGINLESTIHSKSFGMKMIRDDQNPESVGSPIPTPRSTKKKGISKFDYKDNQIVKEDSTIPVSNRKIDSEDKSRISRYSHVKSSGYGTKVITPQKISTSSSSKSQPIPVRGRQMHQNVNQSVKMNGKTYTKPDQQSENTKHNTRSKSVPRFNELNINFQSHPQNETYFNRRNDDKENMYEISNYPHRIENIDGKNMEWQEKWLEERKIVKILEANSLIQERDFKHQIESTTQKYEEKISQLESQLTRMKQQLSSKPDLSNKVLGPNVTKEDITRIEREMKEQSSILAAYEKDNEKLYQEIKILKQQKKGEDKIDSIENERLISQYVSLKAEFDAKDIELRNLRQMTKENRFPRVGNMENKEIYLQEIAELKKEIQMANSRYLQSESEKQRAEMKLDKLSVETDKQLLQSKKEIEIEKMERIKLLESHKLEVDDLKRKIKWYLENQAILDQNLNKIKSKDQEISDLKHQLQSANSIKISSNIRAKEKSADLAKLKRYEDEIMSLKEDLYLLSKGKNIGNIAEKRTIQFLEDKIKSLEADNENVSKKENNALRSLQQQFEAMKFQYEEKINDLEFDLIKKFDNKANPDKNLRITDLRSKIDELNTELEKKLSLISRLKSDLKKSNKASNENLTKECKSKNIRTIELDNRMDMLRKELHDKETEIQRLKIQNAYLKGNDGKEHDLHLPRQSTSNQLELEAENAKFKSQIVHLNRDIVNYKQVIDEMKMTIIQNEEFIRNEAKSEIRKLEDFHRENLNNVKFDYANRHSESDVANLKSQIEIQKNYIGHLQNQITEYNVNLKNYESKTNDLADANKQLEVLKTELSDLRLIWSKKPGLEMIDRLRSKIINLEEKEKLKGRQLDEYIDKIVKNNLKQYEDEVERWRTIVAKKNQNLLLVQNELNRLLEALEELRRQGIVIPNFFDKSPYMKHR